MRGPTGSGSSADKDKLEMKQDKLSQLIEMGDEEAILKLLQGWNYSMEMEKLTDFLEYNQTGLDARHCINFHKLDNFQKANALFAMYEGNAKDNKNKLGNLEVLTG